MRLFCKLMLSVLLAASVARAQTPSTDAPAKTEPATPAPDSAQAAPKADAPRPYVESALTFLRAFTHTDRTGGREGLGGAALRLRRQGGPQGGRQGPGHRRGGWSQQRDAGPVHQGFDLARGARCPGRHHREDPAPRGRRGALRQGAPQAGGEGREVDRGVVRSRIARRLDGDTIRNAYGVPRLAAAARAAARVDRSPSG